MREMNRLLHNQSAAEQGQHVLAPVSCANMKCALCGEEADWRRILQWPKTQCKKERIKEEVAGQKATRGENELAKGSAEETKAKKKKDKVAGKGQSEVGQVV